MGVIRRVSREAAKGKYLGSVRAPKWRVCVRCGELAGDALTLVFVREREVR